jgi:hypothetical protein
MTKPPQVRQPTVHKRVAFSLFQGIVRYYLLSHKSLSFLLWKTAG